MRATHYSEDDLTLYYYGEGGRRADVERHLQECAACAALYREISRTLAMVLADEAPERGEQYGLEVWQRIRHRLPDHESSAFAKFLELFRWERAVWIGAAAALVIAAFVAGRMWRAPGTTPVTNVVGGPSATSAPNGSRGADVRERILLASVADHLDRSERVLTDIMNAEDPSDISTEQRWAEDLLTTSRLYRQDAIDAGEQSVADVLDELERNLLDIVHSPSKISAADLEQLRRRIDAATLLFKVRVMSDELRRREDAPYPRTPTPTDKTS